MWNIEVMLKQAVTVHHFNTPQNPIMEFSSEAKSELDDILSRYPNKQAALLPVLHLVQREFGYISESAVEDVAHLLDLSPSFVAGTVSFYTMYKPREMGRYVIQLCHTLSCSLLGAENILEYLKRKVSIDVGETTHDKKFSLVKVECLGACDKAPAMLINDELYGNLTPEKIDNILDSLP